MHSTAFARSHSAADSAAKGRPLSYPPTICSTLRRGNESERRDRRLGDRGDRIVEPAHAAGFVNELQAMGQPGEIAHRRLRRGEVHAHHPRRRPGGLAVELVVSPGTVSSKCGALPAENSTTVAAVCSANSAVCGMPSGSTAKSPGF